MLFWRSRHSLRDEELSAYVDGQLDAAARARVDAHLETCAACRDELAELRGLRQALSELPRVPAPRSFALREADVGPTEVPRGGGFLSTAPAMLSGLTAAAVLAFVVLVGVDLSSVGSSGGGDGAAREFGATSTNDLEFSAPVGESFDEAGVSEEPAEGLAEDADGAIALPEADGPPAAGDDVQAPPIDEAEPLPREPAPATVADEGGSALRIAEAAAAALALVAGGSLVLVWWRRRA